jgi:murein DD-endopeptidase MepM/ murein hydrolase activator NlpD
MGKGGNVVIVLGPKWRFHYYAHLDSITASRLDYVESGEPIGKLGDSGNAKGRPPHLHYAIIRMIPEPWQADDSTQGSRKAYFIDPNLFLRG